MYEFIFKSRFLYIAVGCIYSDNDFASKHRGVCNGIRYDAKSADK